MVMDNISYHMKIIDPIPTKYSSKRKMYECLDMQNISYIRTMRKPKVFELIKMNTLSAKKYIYELLKDHGHSILRLPSYHCYLNPIELAWAAEKCYIRERNVEADLSFKKTLELSSDGIKSVLGDTWRDTVAMQKDLNQNIVKLDGLVENAFETMNYDAGSKSEIDTASESGSVD